MQNPGHILITGASSGLGKALALYYARQGVALSLTGRNEERLEAVAAEAMALLNDGRDEPAPVAWRALDVCDAGALAAWIVERDQARPLDLIIANAGVSAGTGAGRETTAQIREIFRTNTLGAFNTIQPVIPRMMARRRGQIALMSSLAGFRGTPGAPAYCASKAALRVYGEALRGDLAFYNVEVTVLCPGFVKTPMTDVNAFPMPFLMEADKAAALIAKGLAKGKARLAFPWPLTWIVWLLAALPPGLTDPILTRLPRKDEV